MSQRSRDRDSTIVAVAVALLLLVAGFVHGWRGGDLTRIIDGLLMLMAIIVGYFFNRNGNGHGQDERNTTSETSEV